MKCDTTVCIYKEKLAKYSSMQRKAKQVTSGNKQSNQENNVNLEQTLAYVNDKKHIHITAIAMYIDLKTSPTRLVRVLSTRLSGDYLRDQLCCTTSRH